MAQQNARELTVKRESSPGSNVFNFVCGLRSRSFQMSNAQIDNTVPNCTDPSLPIVATATPGRQTQTFSGDGLFDNDTVGITVADDARTQATTINYQIVVPGYGTFEGPYFVSEFEWSGDMEDPLGFSATWVPTDASLITFTPA